MIQSHTNKFFKKRDVQLSIHVGPNSIEVLSIVVSLMNRQFCCSSSIHTRLNFITFGFGYKKSFQIVTVCWTTVQAFRPSNLHQRILCYIFYNKFTQSVSLVVYIDIFYKGQTKISARNKPTGPGYVGIELKIEVELKSCDKLIKIKSLKSPKNICFSSNSRVYICF